MVCNLCYLFLFKGFSKLPDFQYQFLFFYGFSLGLYIVSWKGNGFYCHRVVPDHPGSWVVYYHNAAW